MKRFLVPSRTPDQGQIPLPAVSRRLKPVIEQRPEAEVQSAIIQALRLCGVTVLVTSRVRKRVRCPRCGEWSWPAGGDGVTRGCPDLLVRRERTDRHGQQWSPRLWLGMEVKPGPAARVREEQLALADAGSIVIVCSVDDALAAVQQVDRSVEASKDLTP